MASSTNTSAYPIHRYLNVRSAYFPGFSSDGSRIAFLSDITGVPQVWQVGLSSYGPLWTDPVTFAPDRVMGVWCSPATGDDHLIYSQDVGGNENAQLFLFSADGSEDVLLTEGHGGAMHLFGEWSRDGKQILFAANRRDPRLFDLYVQALDGEARMVWQNDRPGYLFRSVFSPDGRRVAAVRSFSSFSSDVIEVDLDSGGYRVVSPPGDDVRYESVFYAPDGRSLFVNTDLDSDFLYVGRLDLATQGVEALAAPSWDADVMCLSPDSRYLAYTANVQGVSELYLLDVASGDIRKAPDLQPSTGVIGMMDTRLRFSQDSRWLAFSYMATTRSSDVYVWDIQADTVRAVTRSSHGGLPADTFVSPELIQYPTFDAGDDGPRQIPAWFYRPKAAGDGPVPVVVIVHGGPEAQYRPYFQFLAQYFLQSGYAVLAPNVRGSTGYGKSYSHLDDVRKRMDSVRDLAHAAYWLQEQPGIDGNRLVVYGGSYGGFMVLSALTTYPELWAAGVDIVGISNFVTFLENTSDYRRAHREAEYGSLERDHDFLQEISPLNHADSIAVPLMVIHGANDPRVPLGEAKQLVETLRRRGVPVELIVFDDEGHGIVKLKNKLVAYPAIVDFLARHLER